MMIGIVLIVVKLSSILLSVAMINAVMLILVMLSVIKLNVIIPNVVITNVAALVLQVQLIASPNFDCWLQQKNLFLLFSGLNYKTFTTVINHVS